MTAQKHPLSRICRSLLFGFTFYTFSAIGCILICWLPLVPHAMALRTIEYWMRFFSWLERIIIPLDHVLIGAENLPADGCFIFAAKHQSTWETYKLHRWLKDPAVVMKIELARIPLWGWYAKKMRAIFVDRKAGAQAHNSLLAGALRAKALGRPIVIFPQGTRLNPYEYRPYKKGLGTLYEQLQVPVVPVALNSGLFWPRHGFIKYAGTVTVKIMPPIMPGLDAATMMKQLEQTLESETKMLLPPLANSP